MPEAGDLQMAEIIHKAPSWPSEDLTLSEPCSQTSSLTSKGEVKPTVGGERLNPQWERS